MTDLELVLVKLQRMREYAALARARRPSAPEQLESDLDRRDALALALLVAAQEAIDVAYHITADEGWGLPDAHAAAFEALATNGVIEPELADRVAQVTQIRNRIAHGYVSVDHARIWEELPAGLDALEAYAASVAQWLGR
jgi:uncharacterized protein YutE (UPF0331/DUF86 family)